MGMLTSLKSLDLSNTRPTSLPNTTISPKVISRLFRLEEFDGNDVENLEFISENDASPWKKMTRFRITVSPIYKDRFHWKKKWKFQRSLILTFPSSSISHWILLLLPKTNFLYLLEWKGLESVVQLDPMDELKYHLRCLKLKKCHELKYMISATRENYAFSNLVALKLLYLSNFEAFRDGTISEVAFPRLKELIVHECGKSVTLIPCPDFEGEGVEQASPSTLSKAARRRTRLCHLPPSPIFRNLTDLFIANCMKLKHLFPLRVFQHLSKLERMFVVWCSALEILFPDDSDIESGDVEKDKASHPLLKEFGLFRLPKLSSFSASDSLVVDWPSAKSLAVGECPNLKRLSLGSHSVPKLETFTITDHELFNKLEWDDQNIMADLLTLLEVTREFSDADAMFAQYDALKKDDAYAESEDLNEAAGEIEDYNKATEAEDSKEAEDAATEAGDSIEVREGSNEAEDANAELEDLNGTTEDSKEVREIFNETEDAATEAGDSIEVRESFNEAEDPATEAEAGNSIEVREGSNEANDADAELEDLNETVGDSKEVRENSNEAEDAAMEAGNSKEVREGSHEAEDADADADSTRPPEI
ncbi:hypothetical protein IFM89_034676 [Coptis chinensis]|uniref:Disease resistance protein At4g27190-like leucine-rich repeats domain-containing protein n=1 Tax=Coptis chinensis TaxID=261450 RepID=A0A835HS95_9MAGN|nr:hypothetical protein IFM89_034676 [Coptis chinensis]